MKIKRTEVDGIQTFLFVQRGQNAVVSAHFEVDLLLHAIWNRSLRDDDTDSCLYGAQHPTITIKDAPRRGDHRVSFVFLIVIQCTRARKQTASGLVNRRNKSSSGWCSFIILPDGNGLGKGVDVVVLILGPVVHGACESVDPAVGVQGLGWDLRFQVVVHTGFGLCVVGKQVVVEFGALKLALEGSGGAGVRLGDVAVVAGRDA